MLSILIPTYNYNVYPLVLELHQQCLECEIEFEIIVQDDASFSNLNIENQKINQLSHCAFLVNEKNLGRGKNLNSLSTKSKFDWILIIDCDMFPESSNFIKNYVTNINNKTKVVYGGIIYQEKKPQNYEMLRWVYGKNRESVPISKRIKNPYKHVLTSNILIWKNLFDQITFPDYIDNYGFEDLVLILAFQKNKIEISHLNNACYHLNLEKSAEFITKNHSSLSNLKFLVTTSKINKEDLAFAKLYYLLKKMGLESIIRFVFSKTKNAIIANLTSKNPRLFLFDFYRLGYYSTLR